MEWNGNFGERFPRDKWVLVWHGSNRWIVLENGWRAVESGGGFAVCRTKRLRYAPAMSVEELKAAAAKLSPGDRMELVEWIERNDDIRELRRAALIREIEIGIGELDRGEAMECKDDVELRAFMNGVKGRGRDFLAARNNPAA
jgi:hypothetical protein